MISLDRVTKVYGRQTVLNNISLKFADSRTHVLLGSSGCGKSTLLRLMMGLTSPTSGTIQIQDENMNPTTQRTLVRKMGYVIQDGGLFPHLTVAQNVTLVARTLKWPMAQIQKRLDELVQLVEFDSQLLKKFPSQLSGGQKQRTGLMRALMLDPSILLLDEPLGALDPIVRLSLQRQLKEIFNRLKKTVIIVTHDIGEAAFFGHTVTLLDAGRVIQNGTFEDLVERPAHSFVTEFLVAQKPPPELKFL